MRIVISCFFISISLILHAQQAEEKCTVLQAMHDELKRGQENLILPGHPKAFYLFTQLEQQKTYRVSATMGSLTSDSERNNFSSGNFRILCGTYEFNDESLNHRSEQSMRLPSELPEDTTDYVGIRRSLWITMERVFTGAAKGMTKNEETVRQKGVPIEKIPHRSFAKVTPTKLVKSFSPELLDKPALKAWVRKWSDSLGRVKGMISSDISFSYSRGYSYMCSTEGLMSRLPRSLAGLSISFECKDAAGMLVYRSINVSGTSPAKLINEKWMGEQLALIKSDIATMKNAKALEEPYSGPVLFLGEAVATVFLMAMNDYQEPIVYSDEIEDDNNSMYMARPRIRQSKIGSIITNPGISIKLTPQRHEFGGVELLGAFELDDEGTVPVPFTLIESGAIKGFLNDRTITEPNQPANGYSNSMGGVIEATVKNEMDVKTLRSKLVEEAKKEGLEYGIIFREQSGGLVTMYKVFVSDGHEEVLTPSRMPPISMKGLKKMIGASAKMSAYNLGMDPSGMGIAGMDFGFDMGMMRGSSNLTSFIVPDAMLIGEVDIGAMEFQRKVQPDFIPAPGDEKK